MSAAVLDPARSAHLQSLPAREGAVVCARERRGVAYGLAFLCAVLLHGGIFYVLRSGLVEGPEFSVSVGDSSLEVDLVAAAPAPEAAVEPPVEPVVEPPPPEPPPVQEIPPPPVPEEIPPPPEAMVEPAPPPPVAPPKPQPPKPAKKPAPRRTTAPAVAVGDGSSATPGLDATTARASNGDRAKPGYLRNPHPSYPEEARRARQEGAVQLRIRVSADGSVLSATITRTSGFPQLDERALSTVRERWKFKPARVAGVAIASEVIVPIRFSLRD